LPPRRNEEVEDIAQRWLSSGHVDTFWFSFLFIYSLAFLFI
jgi:hypothetical protein